MIDIPVFKYYWDNNTALLKQIQPNLWLRNWSELSQSEKIIAYNELVNTLWIKDCNEILTTIKILNHEFLRECPWKILHENINKASYEGEKYKLALKDFSNIFLTNKNDSLFYRMISIFASQFIDNWHLTMLKKWWIPSDKEDEYLQNAFKKFDIFSRKLNHIFDQFSVNITLTRVGLYPKQDNTLIDNLVSPILEKLSHPKWTNVNSDLSLAIDAYHGWDYPTSISMAHSTFQRFLQILLNQEEWKNGKWEIWKLIKEAKDKGIFWKSELSQAIEVWLQSFISNTRANKSTSKPSITQSDWSDALLMINIILLFIQQAI